MPGDDYYGLDSTLAPRDVAAEGQLWMEGNALERAEAERPVSVIRASNVQGIPLSGPPGNDTAQVGEESQMGWINIPGDGSNVKDLVHVEDLVKVVDILSNPHPTRILQSVQEKNNNARLGGFLIKKQVVIWNLIRVTEKKFGELLMLTSWV